MKVRIRMYRQGLGDCFLLTFHPDSSPTHMLIDCGTLGATTTGVAMKDVVRNIHATAKPRLDLVVATHEHKDHLSGFRDQMQTFDTIPIGRVWVAWTEKATDSFAQQIRKYQGDLLNGVQAARSAIAAIAPGGSSSDEQMGLAGAASGMSELLGFYGEAGGPLGAFAKTVDEAMDYVHSRAPNGKPDFLEPGTVVEDFIPGVRFYVLGPPRSLPRLKELGEHGHSELYEMAGGFGASAKLLLKDRDPQQASKLSADEMEAFDLDMPFDARFRFDASPSSSDSRELPSWRRRYHDPAADWRRIDYSWLSAAPDMALQLDNLTNNTSLALAIEIVADGRVLLFPADAQVGNWLSWFDCTWRVKEPGGGTREVKMPELLEKTVFYKVGHHASHNATLRDHGLEKMTHRDLIAVIPVDRKVALKKTPPWQMPAPSLYRRLLEKASGRVLRSDTGWPADSERPATVTAAQWKKVPASVVITEENLYFDVTIG